LSTSPTAKVPLAWYCSAAVAVLIYGYFLLENKKRSNVLRFSRLNIVKSAFTGKGLRRARVMFALMVTVGLLMVGLLSPVVGVQL